MHGLTWLLLFFEVPLAGQVLAEVWDVVRARAERDEEGSEPSSSEQLPSEDRQDMDEAPVDMPESAGEHVVMEGAGMEEAGMEEPGMEETGMGETGMGETGMGETGMVEAGVGETGMGEAAPRASQAMVVKEESDDECQIVGMTHLEDLSAEELQRRFEETTEKLRVARLLDCLFETQKHMKSRIVLAEAPVLEGSVGEECRKET